MNSRDIRQSFVDFFVERGHRHEPSAPLVPHGDDTLLFTNAGMVQFKNYFLGLETPPGPRAVTSQKCLRVSGKHNDLENVGPSPRHHTFFEMLGNFSFGDYFKDEAIEFAWDLVTRVWGLPKEHLFATVFREDDEAHELWAKISGLPPERIARCGEKDNFWAMGDTGPCGPCSEIFIDRFPELPKVAFEEGEADGRYLEIWNLVFMQFERAADGSMEPLPKPSIDTGSGLERVAAAMQGHESNYGTDLFLPILEHAAEIAGTRYTGKFDGSEQGQRDTSLRVIADHVRACAFLLADGVLPAADGRGYVLRRILRRAVRHGMALGLEEPFLARLLPTLGDVMGPAFPELGKAQTGSEATLDREERQFLNTIAGGAQKVQEAIDAAKADGRSVLAGDDVFRLYDTYGLPIETVREIAEEEQLGLDEEGFAQALEEQRRRSRAAGEGEKGLGAGLRAELVGGIEPTEFGGYNDLHIDGAKALRLARIGGEMAGESGGEITNELAAGERGLAVFDRTPFYAESGGQVGDHGVGHTAGDDPASFRVMDVQKDAGVFVHTVEVERGVLEVGASLDLQVDAPLRRRTESHHTATHLLHAALRDELGDGVRQAGSLVHPERLRFDFTHGEPLSAEQKRSIEESVNEWVRAAEDVNISERSYQEAVDAGAMALFGEKYGDVVRTVDVPNISLELCGGCHVRNTGQIGSFVLVGERGVAAGVRRVEAVAGELADDYRRERETRLETLEQELGATGEDVVAEVQNLKMRVRDLEKDLKQARMQLMTGGGDASASEQEEVAGLKVTLREVDPAPVGELRSLADVLRQRLGSGVVVLGARGDDKVTLLAAVTSDLEGTVHAGQLAKSMGAAIGGSGGGRPDFAQAGGKDPGSLDGAFAAARAAIEEQMKVGA